MLLKNIITPMQWNIFGKKVSEIIMINRPDVINGHCGPVGLDGLTGGYGPEEPGPEIQFLQSSFLVHIKTKR